MVICCLVTWKFCTTLFCSYLPSQVFPELFSFPHSPNFGGSKPFKAICADQNILGCMLFLWNMVNLWNITHLDKSDPSFSSNYLLQGVGLCAHHIYACWDLVWLGFTQVLCMLSQLLSSYMQFICVVSSYVLCPEDVPLQSSPAAALTLSALYFHNDPWALGWGCNGSFKDHISGFYTLGKNFWMDKKQNWNLLRKGLNTDLSSSVNTTRCLGEGQ